MNTDWLQSLKPGDKVIVYEGRKAVDVVTIESINSHNQILVDKRYRYFHADSGLWHGGKLYQIGPWSEKLEIRIMRAEAKRELAKQCEYDVDWRGLTVRQLKAILKIAKGEK